MRQSIKQIFQDVFVAAEKACVKCPVRMGGAGNIDLLYWIADYLEAENVIETGVAYGWSSLALLLSLSKRDHAMLLSTDMPYVHQNIDSYVGCCVPDRLKSRWRIIRLADRQALPQALKTFQAIDMCHYDSDKSYEGKMWAYPRLWKALRLGGCFISDDVGDNLAFRDFCGRITEAPLIVRTPTAAGVKYVGVLRKNKLDWPVLSSKPRPL